jgi:ArsR family transcriptional regulator, arsenate/arsenite/antimonite-responsive transcriptional repressor
MEALVALARSTEFPAKDMQLSEYAKAIAHPARIAILRALAERREVIVGDLVLDLPLAQSTVSQHLRALKEIGLIKGRIDGPRSLYCINWKNYERFKSLFNHLEKYLDRFEAKAHSTR